VNPSAWCRTAAISLRAHSSRWRARPVFWVWFRSGEIDASAGVVLFSFIAYLAWRRLDPERCFLLISEEGIQESLPFGRPLNLKWTEIESFSVHLSDHGTESVVFKLRDGKSGREFEGKLSDTYGFSAVELVQLLNRRVRPAAKGLLTESCPSAP